MAAPIITLITDFGLTDHYVAAMKGVILGICPRARLVDVSHGVTPYTIAEGAYLIAQTYPFFPKKTVHVAVIDPGVGSARRAILVEAAGQYFVGPDNGVFSMVMEREKYKARVLDNPRYFRVPVSRTFHGRDLFAPSAAHLAAGVPATRMGKPIRDAVTAKRGEPRVLHIDRFGNVVTSLRESELPRTGFRIEIGGVGVSHWADHYEDIGPGELGLIVGSMGYLEVSMNQGSAAERIGCRVGDRVRMREGPAPV